MISLWLMNIKNLIARFLSSPENALVWMTLRNMSRFYGNHPLGVRFECGTEINATCDNN